MKKVVLVTGANKGIGFEICRRLAELGHTVILGARDLTKGEKAMAQIEGNARVKQLDVTNEEDIFNISNYINTEFGRLDVLINNAGIISGKSTVDENIDRAKEIMDTNFYGAWRMSQAMLPLIRKSDDGRIINMSSGMGAFDSLVGGYAAYRLSKFALNGFTIQLANELENTVKVNAMCPGWVRTDMGGQAAPRSVNQGADTAVWLATEKNIPTGKFFRDRKIISW